MTPAVTILSGLATVLLGAAVIGIFRISHHFVAFRAETKVRLKGNEEKHATLRDDQRRIMENIASITTALDKHMVHEERLLDAALDDQRALRTEVQKISQSLAAHLAHEERLLNATVTRLTAQAKGV